MVAVGEGGAVQVRSLGPVDAASRRGGELAVADYGPIRGFPVEIGTPLDPDCSPDLGRRIAQLVASDRRVAGVVGPRCSDTAAVAAPVLAAAGLSLISPSATSPALTSDLRGTAGGGYSLGFYRTAHNDLYQGEAVARFLVEERGLTAAAAVHSGGPYTQGLARAFAEAFGRLGGKVTAFVEVDPDGADTGQVLAGLAAGGPQALYLPLREPAAAPIARQARSVPGLEAALLVGADALLYDSFLGRPESEGMFFSGPGTSLAGNTNQGTGKTTEQVLASYQQTYGEPPAGAFWEHGYDAAAILLDAIQAASRLSDGTLLIDLAGVREYLSGLREYQGITGTLGCDDFGDCGSQRIAIIEHTDHRDIQASRSNIIYHTNP